MVYFSILALPGFDGDMKIMALQMVFLALYAGFQVTHADFMIGVHLPKALRSWVISHVPVNEHRLQKRPVEIADLRRLLSCGSYWQHPYRAVLVRSNYLSVNLPSLYICACTQYNFTYYVGIHLKHLYAWLILFCHCQQLLEFYYSLPVILFLNYLFALLIKSLCFSRGIFESSLFFIKNGKAANKHKVIQLHEKRMEVLLNNSVYCIYADGVTRCLLFRHFQHNTLQLLCFGLTMIIMF